MHFIYGSTFVNPKAQQYKELYNETLKIQYSNTNMNW